MEKTKIAVVGCGRMGSALVRAYLRAGYTTHVWNRTPERCQPLVDAGARKANSIQEAAQVAEVVISNVNDYATSNSLYRDPGVATALRGKVLVQLTAGTPADARDLAAWAAKNGVHYLDGGILVTPDLIGQTGALIFYSGKAHVFEQYKSYLQVLAENSVYVAEDPGHASTVDMALQSFFWGAMFGIHHAAALCQAEEFPLERYARLLPEFLPFIQHVGSDVLQRIADGNFTAEAASLEVCHLSTRHILKMTRDNGIDAALPAAFDHLYQKAFAAGLAQADFSSLNQVMKTPTEVAGVAQ